MKWEPLWTGMLVVMVALRRCGKPVENFFECGLESVCVLLTLANLYGIIREDVNNIKFNLVWCV